MAVPLVAFEYAAALFQQRSGYVPVRTQGNNPAWCIHWDRIPMKLVGQFHGRGDRGRYTGIEKRRPALIEQYTTTSGCGTHLE